MIPFAGSGRTDMRLIRRQLKRTALLGTANGENGDPKNLLPLPRLFLRINGGRFVWLLFGFGGSRLHHTEPRHACCQMQRHLDW